MAKSYVISNVGDVTRWLESIQKKIETLDDRLMERICRKTVEEAKRILTDTANALKIDIGSLAEAITYRRLDNGRYIIVAGEGDDAEDLMYLEYGTGLQGSVQQHRFASGRGWQYQIGEHIMANGWWIYYSPNSQIREPNSFQTGRNKDFTMTTGMPAKMFMYRTMQALPSIIKKEMDNFMNEIRSTK